MASFGSFETDREIYSDPLYTVYGAKRSGDPTSEYVVKVFTIHRVGFEVETAADLGPLLSDLERARLKSIEVQKKGAASSAFIAAVLESDHDDRGVWYATRFYPRSVNKIISGRVALTVDALQHILHSIAQGALDFKRACGRSHGDIRPSNVQISKSERLSKADVVLCDPLPEGEEQPGRHELADLRAIGQILLQLVRQRSIEKEEDFLILPILSSAEWTRLFGKDTDRWLSLCNRLLDPNLSLERLTLDQLVAELEQLQPKSGVSPKLVIAAATILLCLIGVVVWVMRPRTQTLDVTSDPPGATILLDKKEQAQRAPLKLDLKKGTYIIEARHEKLPLAGQSTNWVVTSGASAKLHFKFPYGSVAIKSVPPGATITGETGAIGKTPADGSAFVIQVVPAGTEVKYELSLSEHGSKSIGGVVTNGQTLPLFETLPLSTDVGWIELDSIPRGAAVYLKDKVVSAATPQKVDLEQGTYTLTAVYHDWPPKDLAVKVTRRETVDLKFDFEKGKIAVDSDPSGASVWVGTNSLGNTPIESVLRPAGETTFRFEMTGFETTNQIVKVANNGRASVKAVLQSTNGVFELSADPGPASIVDANGKELRLVPAGRPAQLTMAPGTYLFGARADGLSEVAPVSLKVERRGVTKYTFHFDYGSVLLDSVPSGAAISVDGKAMGVTPAPFVQKPGAKIRYRIAAPDYLPVTNEVTVQNQDRKKSVVVSLTPEPVSVALISDPPGAQFFVGPATILGTGSSYSMPWGTNQVTAKYASYPALGEKTRSVVVKKGAQNRADFTFDFGTVVLTNVPEEFVVKEGGKELPAAPGTARLAYDRPGQHTYDLYDGAEKLESLTTNVLAGSFTVLMPKEAGEIKNSIGMRLVKIHNLLGPGKDCWVGKYEVTQGEYQMIMGANPSAPPLGDNYPVENVSWDQAMEFCQKLKASDEKKPPIRGDYRLPTRDQWQFFAEGTDFKDAVIRAKSVAPVGSKAPNLKHLYDVLGNVWEWLGDNDGTNSQIIGEAYNVQFGAAFGRTNKQKRNWSEADVGFRVILIPGGATAAAK